MMVEEGIEMSLLPEGWSLEERVGHQSLSFAEGEFTFLGRFGESLLYETGNTEVSWWVLVSRNHIAILTKPLAALAAFIGLESEPALLNWDGLNGVLTANTVTAEARLPVLSMVEVGCASRSVESCGLEDAGL